MFAAYQTDVPRLFYLLPMSTSPMQFNSQHFLLKANDGRPQDMFRVGHRHQIRIRIDMTCRHTYVAITTSGFPRRHLRVGSWLRAEVTSPKQQGGADMLGVVTNPSYTILLLGAETAFLAMERRS